MPTTDTLKQVQARSGLHFAFFLVLHFICHCSLSLGWDMANSNLLLFRKLYQHQLFEALMLISVIAHMYSNAALFIVRQNMAPSEKEEEDDASKKVGAMERKAHQIAGYILAFSIIGHVAAVRIGPMFLMEDPSQYDYGFVARVNKLIPADLFIAFLAIFGMAGGWHMIYGVRSAITTFQGSSVVGKPFPMSLKVLALMSHIGIISAVLAIGGYLYPVDTSEKDEIIDNYIDSVQGIMLPKEAAEL